MCKKKLSKVLVGLLMSGTLMFGTAAVASCSETETPEIPVEKVDGAYHGVYYLETAEGKTYEIVVSELAVVYSVNNETKAATFTNAGDGKLTFTYGEEETDAPVSATFGDKEVVLTYADGSTATLFKKVNFTVTFDAGEGETQTTTVYNGQSVAKPATDPVREGYKFRGWYADAEYTEVFNFGVTPVRKDVTIYAKWIKLAEVEYQITLNLGYGDDPASVYETMNHGLDEEVLTPVREGYTFDGWWTSDFDDAAKLSARFDTASGFSSDVTLYARWLAEAVPGGKIAAPKVEMDRSTGRISWTPNSAARNGYRVVIEKDGEALVDTTINQTSYTYADYATLVGGDYTISVTALATAEANNSETTVIAYRYKTLAPVSGFEVENQVLFFDGAENADRYIITIDCGDEGHKHVEVDNGKSLYYDFSSCPMPEDGITFTVTAESEGYVSSVATFTYSKVLAPVEALSYDSATQTVSWNPVSYAAYYVVTVNGVSYNCGSDTSFSVKTCALGEIKVSVRAYAKGYYSPAAAELAFDKATLATPDGVKVLTTVDGETATTVVSWNEVAGATGYVVTVDGTSYTVSANSVDVTDLLALAQQGTDYRLTITATCDDAAKTSLASDALDIRYLAMGATVEYKEGNVSWTPVAGATGYGVSVNGGTEVLIRDGSSSAKVTFTQAGNNTVSVRFYDADGSVSEWISVTVFTYQLTVYKNDPDETKPVVTTKYYAYGDKIEIETPSRIGYKFGAWYSLPGGAADNGTKFEEKYFTEKRDVSVYATWEAKEITVNLVKPNDVSIGTGIEKYTTKFGTEDYSLPVATHESASYIFLGWYTAAGGKGTRVSDSNGNAVGKWSVSEDNANLYPYFIDAFKFSVISEDNKTCSVTMNAGANVFSSIVIPAFNGEYRVTMIETKAFKNFTNLQRVYIPDTIKTIFLTDNNSTKIADHSFTGCSNLREIGVVEVKDDEGNPVEVQPAFRSGNGMLVKLEYSGGEDEQKITKQTLSFVPVKNSAGGTLTVPSGVTHIPSGAFRFGTTALTMTKVVIPNTVQEIGGVQYVGDSTTMDTEYYGAFYSCTSLEEVEFEAGGKSPLTIGGRAFYGCSKLEKVTLPARTSNLVIDEKYTTYYFDIFASCSALSEVNVREPEGEETWGNYRSIDGVLFSDGGKTLLYYPKFRDITDSYAVPEGTLKIERDAFYSNHQINEVVIPNTVREVCERAFYSSYLSKVVFKGDRAVPLDIKDYAFYLASKLTDIVFEKGEGGNTGEVTIGAKAFYGSSSYNLNNLEWEDANVVSVGDYAFYYAKFDEVVIPETVTHIGQYAFQNNLSLTKLTFKVRENFDYAANPDKCLEMEDYAFKGCALLSDVLLPVSMKEFSLTAFDGCGISVYQVAEGSAFMSTTEDGVIYNGDKTKLIYFPSAAVTSTLTFADTLEEIGGSVFEGNTTIRKVVIPASMKKIGTKAFYGCTSLAEIEFVQPAEGQEVVDLEIGNYAFGATGASTPLALAKVDLPSRVSSIGAYAFYYNKNIQGRITIPANCSYVGAYAFYNCTGVEELVIEGGDKELQLGPVGYYASSSTSTGSYRSGYSFGYMNIKSVVIPARVTVIGNQCFTYCKQITSFVFDDIANSKLRTVGVDSFEYCQGITEFVLPAGRLSNIPYEYDPNNAVNQEIEGDPDLMTPTYGVGKWAFEYMYGLKRFEFSEANAPANPEEKTYFTFDTYVFSNSSALETVVLPSNLCESTGANGVKVDIFCRTEVAVGVNYIYTFNGCTSLKSLEMPANDGLYACEGGAIFKKDPSTGELSELIYCPIGYEGVFHVPETVSLIDSRAFYDCTRLTGVVFDSKTDKATDRIQVGSVLNNASSGSTYCSVFYNCDALEYVSFPETAEVVIGDHAFYYLDVGFKGVQFPTTKKVTIGRYAFYYCKNFLGTGTAEDPATGTLLMNNVDIIYDYAFYHCDRLKSVDFGNSAKEIKEYAFYYCVGLESIVIPNTIEWIGSSSATSNNVFYYNTKLTSVTFRNVIFSDEATKTLKDGYTLPDFQIGLNAFYGCSALTEFTVPNTLTVIGNTAFQNCTSFTSLKYGVGESALKTIGNNAFKGTALTSLTLPDTLTKIGTGAFDGCNLTTISIPAGLTDISGLTTLPTIEAFTVSATNENYIAIDGVLYSKDGTELKAYPCAKAVEGGVFIPGAGVSKIGENAFYMNTSVTKVVLTKDIIQVGGGAFRGCENITEIVIQSAENVEDEKMLELGDYAFAQTSISTIALPARVNAVGDYLLYNCKQLQNVQLGFKLTEKAIPAYMFSGCSALTGVVIPEGITAIGAGAFANCVSLTNIAIPDEVTEIGGGTSASAGAFSGCTGLTHIVFGEESKIAKLGGYAFSGCTNLISFTALPSVQTVDGVTTYTLTLPAGITTIPAYLFNNTSKNVEGNIVLNLPAGLNKVEGYGFRNCFFSTVHFVAAEIPVAVTLAQNALAYCYADVIFDNEAKIANNTIDNKVFYYFYGTKVRFPATLQKIKTATSARNSAFYNSTVETIEFPANSVLTTVGGYAFYYAKKLETIRIPDSVTTIEKYAFYHTDGLKNVTLPQNAGFKTIAANTFYYSGIESISIPSTVTKIEASAFDYCKSLASVTFNEVTEGTYALTEIGNFAFRYGTYETFEIPSSVKTLGYGIFGYTTGLKELVIPETVTKIAAASSSSYGMFYQSSIEKVTLPSKMASLDVKNMFHTAKNLKTVTYTGAAEDVTGVNLPDYVKDIGNYAFYGCISLEKAHIGNKITSIGNYAFATDANLTEVTFAEDATLTTIGYNAFKNLGAKKIVIPASVTALKGYTSVSTTNYGVFAASALEAVYFAHGSKIDTIGNYAFAESAYLKEVRELGEGEAVPETVSENPVVALPASVTLIEHGAFKSCGSVEKIVIPEKAAFTSITSSSYGVFYGCKKLNSIEFKCPLESLPAYAFYGCTSMTEFEVPASVKEIGANDFKGMTSLRKVTFAQGSACESVANNAFAGLNVQEVSLPASIKTIGARAFSGCKDLATIKFEEGSLLESIGEGAFRSCEVLNGVTLPASVKEIGASAFAGATSLTAITLPAAVETLGDSAFEGATALATVLFAEGSAVEVIPQNAFYGCTALASVTLPSTLKEIGAGAFESAVLTSITLPETLETVGANAFYGVVGLTAVTLPDSLTTIGSRAFDSVNVFTLGAQSKFKLDEKGILYDGLGVTVLSAPKNIAGAVTLLATTESIGDYAFADRAVASVTFAEKTFKVGEGAFYGCSALSSVALNEGLTEMGDYAFARSGLTAITIPSTLLVIPAYAFAECESLAAFNVAVRSDPLAIGEYAFAKTALTSLTIDETVVSVGEYAFAACSALRTITIAARSAELDLGDYAFAQTAIEEIEIPNYRITLGNYLFGECTSLKKVTILSEIEEFKAEKNNIFAGCSALEEVTLPASLKTLNANTFRGLEKLKTVKTVGSELNAEGKVVLPAGVSIGANAFTGSGITNVTVTAGSVVGNGAFSDCALLSSVTIEEGVETIGASAFENCVLLASVQLPSTLTELGDYAFDGCELLGSIVLPEGVTQISSYLFRDCVSLESVTMLGSVTDIGAYAFYGCVSLPEFDIPDTVSVIGTYAFYGCTSLKKVVIPTALDDLSSYGFAECTSLEEADFSKVAAPTFTSSTTGQYMFMNTALKEFIFPEVNPGTTSTYLPTGMFYGCTQLKKADLGNYFKYIYYGAFFGCSSLTEVTGLGYTTYIYGPAFAGCSSLDFTIPATVTGVSSTTATPIFEGKGPFTGIKSLKSESPNVILENGMLFNSAKTSLYWVDPAVVKGTVTIPEGVTNVYTGAFSGCDEVKKVILPASISSSGIYYSAFANCAGLEEVDFSRCKTLTTIYQGAFANCVSLREVILPDNVVTVSGGAFYNCTSLETFVGRGVYGMANMVTSASPTYIYSNHGTLEGCTSLKNVEFGTLRTTSFMVYHSSFKNCTSLESITIPAFVNIISASAFEGCTSLANVTMTKVEEIGEYAFKGCKSLRSIQLPDTLEYIDEGAFYASGLREISIPGSVSTISERAFQNCKSLQRVFINDGTKTIEGYAFAGCTKANILIAKSVTKIDYTAFSGFKSTQKIYFAASEETVAAMDYTLSTSEFTTAEWNAMTEEEQQAYRDKIMQEFNRVKGDCFVYDYTGDLPPLTEEAETNEPYVGENGNWWIGDQDTGIKAYYVGENGNWWIGNQDTGIKANVEE